MEIPTMADFERLENMLNSKIDILIDLIKSSSNRTEPTKMYLTVKDLEEEYQMSAYLQRLARSSGQLAYITGAKEIKYNREEVNKWIESQTVK